MADNTSRHDPITATEFNKAFQALWKVGGGKKAFMRLGFAVSGGVDSMALAYLWSQLRRNRPAYNPYVRGFVVDHRLRPGSAEEAKLVATRLESWLGQPAQIITLDWSKYGGPEDVRRVETAARRLRFQALGQVARSHSLQCLLLAHHADDAVETALFRMANGAQGTGLAGFRSVANIPECNGEFGVHTSGSFQRLISHETMHHYVGGPEEGGIKVARPLLGFPKSRLIATCKTAGVEWVEDSTNQDTRLTPRNAIRAMVKDNVLPAALQQASMQLLLKDIKDTNEIRQSITRRLYAATKVQFFDLRSGVIHLYLPSSSTVADLIQEFADQNLVFEAFTALLHSFGECISPAEIFKLEYFKPASMILFKELTANQGISTETPLNVAHLNVERIKSLKLAGVSHIGLRLYRAGFISHFQHRRVSKENLVIRPTGRLPKLQSLPHQTHQWQLWDGRWWMSVKNYSPVVLRVEALSLEKLQAFQKNMHGYEWRAYRNLFSEAAPSSSKWTIPAIVCDDPPSPESMIRPKAREWKGRVWLKPISLPVEILKYRAADVLPNDPVTNPPSIPVSIRANSLDPSLFASGDNLSRPPESTRRLMTIPGVPKGPIDEANYPEHTGPFIVAIPTMEIFLNSYWADRLDFDIRYKSIPLPDMNYISRYRFEKPVTIDGVASDAVPTTIKNEVGV